MQKRKFYPIWEIPEGREVVVRLLPDLNTKNHYGFLSEVHTHNFVEDPERPNVHTTVLCSKKHEPGKICLHCKMADRKWRNNHREARKWFRTSNYYANILVMRDPDNLNGIRNYPIILGGSIIREMKDQLRLLKYDPSDFKNGYNLHIRVEKQGYWRRYIPQFKKKKLSKPDRELAKNSLIDLSTLHPKRYSSEFNDQLQAIMIWDILNEE